MFSQAGSQLANSELTVLERRVSILYGYFTGHSADNACVAWQPICFLIRVRFFFAGIPDTFTFNANTDITHDVPPSGLNRRSREAISKGFLFCLRIILVTRRSELMNSPG